MVLDQDAFGIVAASRLDDLALQIRELPAADEIEYSDGAGQCQKTLAGQRLLRLRLPLPRAPENVTVCEEPLTDTRMRPEISYSLL